MKTLGEAAINLRWIAPSVASLTTLANSPLASVWTHVRADPGLLLLAARTSTTGPNISPAKFDHDLPLLETALNHLHQSDVGCVDWNQPGPAVVYRTCYRQALLASRLADIIGCDAQHAWVAGFLTPLGWLAVTAADPQRVQNNLDELRQHQDASAWQQRAWGHDHTAIARRLSRSWRFPVWLTAILSNLGLHVNIAERLGAQPALFQLVQLTVLLLQKRERGLALPVGAVLPELLGVWQLNATDMESIVDTVLQSDPPAQTWETPTPYSLLTQILSSALEHRRQNDSAWIERLQEDIDRMAEALVQQSVNNDERLQGMKLSALAEFAAGAGHEINNPLAVISGQAQYALKQLEWLNVSAEDIENVGQYLAHLHAKISPSLQKIMSQTQRIHAILTDLMQFARPSTPRLQAISVKALMHEVTESLQTFAQERNVRLVSAEPECDVRIQADPTHARVALGSLLRNAIEAAPTNGQAGVRAETDGKLRLELIVEDNGQSPPPSMREHLFDPFYSGRAAGRGRGMGLPTAWRLARQQGGDVRYDGTAGGLTRFVLSLPLAPLLPSSHVSNGKGHAGESMHNGLRTSISN